VVAEIQEPRSWWQRSKIQDRGGRDPKGSKVVVAEIFGVYVKALQEAVLKLLVADGDPAAVLLGSCDVEGKVLFLVALSTAAVKL
jgi:hypothetical protein